MRDRFLSIQVCRAFAAILVVLHHMEQVSSDLSPLGGLLPGKLHEFGFFGVDVFFVISGFIMSHVTSNSISVSKFAWSRIARILPSYWVVTLIWIALIIVSGTGVYHPEFVIKSLAVFPQAGLPALGPGWTLEHEAIFYVFVAAFLAAGILRYLPAFLIALGSIGSVIHLAMPAAGYADVWDWHLFSPYNLNFAFGVLIHRYRNSIPLRVVSLLGAFGIIGLVLAGFATNAAYAWGHVETQPVGFEGAVRIFLGLVVAILIVVAVVGVEIRSPKMFERMTVLRAIGDSSYALYLLHSVAFAVLSVLLEKALPINVLVAWVACSASFVIVIVGSYIWYDVIEKRITAALQFRRSARV